MWVIAHKCFLDTKPTEWEMSRLGRSLDFLEKQWKENRIDNKTTEICSDHITFLSEHS